MTSPIEEIEKLDSYFVVIETRDWDAATSHSQPAVTPLGVRIENESRYHTTEILIPVVDFVCTYTSYSPLATLRVTDLRQAHHFSGGFARKLRLDVSDLSLVAPGLITVELSRGAVYPRTTRYVEEVGPIVVESFEEEFLVVLAHEAKHFDDFAVGLVASDHKHEVRAERFAVKLLRKWRRSL